MECMIYMRLLMAMDVQTDFQCMQAAAGPNLFVQLAVILIIFASGRHPVLRKAQLVSKGLC